MAKENIFKRGWHQFVSFFKNTSSDNLFRMEGCTPPHKAILFALQHIFAMYIGNIAPILLIVASVNVEGIEANALIQNAIFMAGLSTILQLYAVWWFGAKLPLFCGCSFTFVGMSIYIASSSGYGSLVGSLIVASIFIVIMGLTAKYLRRFIKPIVSSSVVLAIGLSLLTVSGDYFAGSASTTSAVFAYGSWQSLLVGFITLLSCLLFQIFVKGTWKNLSSLFGIVIGYIAALCFPGGIDYSGFAGVQVFSLPRLYDFSLIRFDIGAILPMCLIFLVSSTQVIGDVTVCCKAGLGREPTDREIAGSISTIGLTSGIGACFGVTPLTVFSQNVGIVGQTKVINRFTFLLGGLLVILTGLFPPLVVAMRTIPYPVLGGTLTILFASIAVTGVKLISEIGWTPKNILITTLSFGVGFGFSLIPNFYKSLGPIAENILSNPIAMIFILSLILSFAIPEKFGQENTVASSHNQEDTNTGSKQ